MSKTRKPISKRLRFEVFKRDSFKCQYCGSAAPEVLLVIDHIEPVVLQGTNEILNLITACVDCNSGKGARRLSDNTVAVKARNQLEELQSKREQLEMMIEWRRGLSSLADDSVQHLVDYWIEKAPGFAPNENGVADIRKWLRRFSFDEILGAMDIASDQYLAYDDHGGVTVESWELAFKKIGGICQVTRDTKDDPDLRELFYIRGILKNRLGYFDMVRGLERLKAARSWDVQLAELREMALRVRSWTRFREEIEDMITRQRQLLGEDVEGE